MRAERARRLGWGAAAAILGIAGLGAAGAGAEPRLVPFQARLVNDVGTPIEGVHDLLFAIYATPTGGGPLWQESHGQVGVDQGRVSVVLGATEPIVSNDEPIDLTLPRYLGISVDGEALLPRQRLIPAFHAVAAAHADDAGLLGGFPAASFGTDADLATLKAELDERLARLEADMNDLEDAIADLPPAPERVGTGTCNGQVVIVSDDEVHLVPYNSRTLVVEVDGELRMNDGALVYSWSDLDEGPEAEAPDTFYYLYVQSHGAEGLLPLVSASPPVARAHPTIPGTRYVGEFYNDAAEDMAGASHNPLTGEYQLEQDVFPDVDLPNTWATNYELLTGVVEGRLPVTASAVLLQLTMWGDDVVYYIGHESALGRNGRGQDDGDLHRVEVLPTAGARVENFTFGELNTTDNEVFWLPVDGSDPKLTRSVERWGDEDRVLDASLAVLGWRSLR